MPIDAPNPSDPLQSLPSELFTNLLLLLTPRERAVTTAISRAWRLGYLTEYRFHKEIDLTSWNGNDGRDQRNPYIEDYRIDIEFMSNQANRILEDYHRLSQISGHKVEKVSLNLTSFWDDFEVGSYDDFGCCRMESPPGKPWMHSTLGLLIERLRLSERTLREVNIKVNPRHPSCGDQVSIDFVFEFSTFLKDLLAFERLEHVRIEGPSRVSIAGGKDVKGMKFISLSNNSVPPYPDGPLPEDGYHEFTSFLYILGIIQRFVGCDQMRELVLPSGLHGYQYMEESQMSKHFQALNSSRFNLTSLDIHNIVNTNADQVLPLVAGFPNLNTLSLNLRRKNNLGSLRPIRSFASIPAMRHLKKLDFRSKGYQYEWSDLTRWVGGNLEDLTLRHTTSANTSHCPANLLSLLLDSSNTLKTINLRGISLSHDSHHPLPGQVISFPNLKSLSLGAVYPEFYNLFSQISPGLLNLTLVVSTYQYTQDPQAIWQNAINVVRKNCRSLKELQFHGYFSHLDHCALPRMILNFRSLRKLTVTGNMEFKIWLSNSNFPSLVELDLDRNERRPAVADLAEIRRRYTENAPNLR